MSEALPGEGEGSTQGGSQGGRLDVRYDPGEDRLLMHLPVTEGEALRFWLTRRVTRDLLRQLALTASLPPIATAEEPPPSPAPAPAGESNASAAASAAASAPSQPSRPPARRAVDESPMVLRSASFLGASHVGLLLFKLSGARAHVIVNLEPSVIEHVFSLLSRAAMRAAWNLSIPQLRPPGQSGRQSHLS